MFKKLLIPLCLLVLCHARAQQPAYPFTSLNIHHGLSNNQVNCIYKDDRGFLWFGTLGGLNRYDGTNFRVFRHIFSDSLSLSDDYIVSLFPAPDRRMYIRTRNGDNLYDPRSEQFMQAGPWLKSKGLPEAGMTAMVLTGDTCWAAYADSGLYRLLPQGKASRIALPMRTGVRIADIKQEDENHLMLLWFDGALTRLDIRNGRTVWHSETLCEDVSRPPVTLSLFIDAQKDCWVYMPGSDFGVLYFQTATGSKRSISRKTGILNNDIVNSIIQDDHGLMWIGTDHGGVNVLDKQTFRARFLINRPEDSKSLAENAVYALYKDRQGIVWCGTYKRGVSYFAENKMKFALHEFKHGDPLTLPYNDVNCFAEDKKGNLWIGTNGGGLIYYDRKAHTYRQYRHKPGDENSLSNDVIVSLHVDKRDQLWIGYYFGGMDYFSNGRFTHYRHSAKDANSLANKTVWKLYEDSRNNFWVGTLGGGLDRFDRSNGIFYHNNADMANSVHSNYITAFAETPGGDLWIGTAYGIDVLDKSKGIFIHLLRSTHQLSNDNVTSLLCDRQGRMWAGTREGLSYYDPASRNFRTFRITDGLPDNTIVSMLEDDNGWLWVSTTRGISRIRATGVGNELVISCRNYDEQDGLQGKVFNVNAALRLRSGEMVFGGADGFNLFNPAEIKESRTPPALVFTGLQLFNKTIGAGESFRGHVVLDASLPETRSINLRYNENDFSVDFASLNFRHADKNRYEYKLEGFNKEWMLTDGKTRRISYTNINPGNYTLHVRSSPEDGNPTGGSISLQIRILSPWWATGWAYTAYVLLLIAALYLGRQAIIRRAHRRFALQNERKEAQRLHEMDMMKIKLLTNVSHELRTPVSLILSPIEDFIRRSDDEGERQQFQLIRRNARRLLNLVNQLMDFRKMEMQELRTDAVPGELMGFLRESVQSFSDLAERKGVALTYSANTGQLHVRFDHDKLERIVFNLLSNAFKFTPAGGTVEVTASVTPEEERAWLELRVRDTGIGIPPDRIGKIFERYFQADHRSAFVSPGSGIGLAITREFVTMQHGTVEVESIPDQGSCFTVRIPYDLSAYDAPEHIANDTPVPAAPLKVPEAASRKGKRKQTILLVEDTEDFRFYLKENLQEYYNVLEAADGEAGWQAALSAQPDLVVSDITMPGMDGLALCRKIRSHARTRQIPVILLTAMGEENIQLQGLDAGAADYLVKPFSFEIMLSRVRNLLERKAPVQWVIPKDAEPEQLSADEKFMQRALEIVEKNLSDAEFSVEALSRELCMNRVSVYKRIYALSGQPPIEFIRSVRLRRAADLLVKTEMNIAEVAYEVGFNNPKYFARYFKIAYHMLPSAYATAMRK